MQIFLGLIGIATGVLLIKFRETIGNMFGEPAWAEKIGGIYNVLIVIGVFICFWGLAAATGTEDILFRPLLWLIPGARNTNPTGIPVVEF